MFIKILILQELLYTTNMKAKDLIYIAIIGGLGYLLFLNKKKKNDLQPIEESKTNGITDAPANNASLPDLFGAEEGTEIQPIEPIVQEASFTEKPEVDLFTIPYANYKCTYSKIDGRFYSHKTGVLIKTSKQEITEADYLRALNYYEKKVLPCLNKQK